MTPLSEIKMTIAKAKRKGDDVINRAINLGLNHAIRIIEIYERTERIRRSK